MSKPLIHNIFILYIPLLPISFQANTANLPPQKTNSPGDLISDGRWKGVFLTPRKGTCYTRFILEKLSATVTFYLKLFKGVVLF